MGDESMGKFNVGLLFAVMTGISSFLVQAQSTPSEPKPLVRAQYIKAGNLQRITDNVQGYPTTNQPVRSIGQSQPARTVGQPPRRSASMNVMESSTPIPTPFFNESDVMRASYQDPTVPDTKQQSTISPDMESIPAVTGEILAGDELVGSFQSRFNTETLEYRFAEVITLRGEDNIGKIKRVVASREGFIQVLRPVSKPDGTLISPSETVRILTRKLGTVQITVLGEKGSKEYRVVVTPSIELIEGLLMRQFPASSISLTAVGEDVLMLEGFVETATDAEGMEKLLKGFVGPRGHIINAIQVAGVTQVQLEAVIARVDRSGLRKLGMDTFFASQDGFGGLPLSGKTTLSLTSDAAGNRFSNLTGPTDGLNTGTAFLGITDNAKQFLFRIEALQQRGIAKILARPSLVTLSGRTAEFLVGGEQPFPIATSNLANGVQFKKFGTRLNVLPVIIGPDKIRLELVPEVSSVNSNIGIVVGDINVPQFQIQRVHTTVEMAPNETLVIGGLLQTVTEATVRKVPVLGNLPWIGGAFRNVSHNESEQELLILVTPRLVHPTSPGNEPCSLPGLESRAPTDAELFLHGLPETNVGQEH